MPTLIRAATAMSLLAALLWFATSASPARADGDPSRDIVRAVDVVMTVEPGGTVHVEETYQWDFRDRNGLGFYRELITAQGYDETRVRLYEYSDIEVTSPSGAPAEVWVERNWGGLARLAVGAPDGSADTRTGLQSYVLSYDAAGLLNPIRGDTSVGDRDELYTNIFQGISNPMERVTVTVTGPAEVIDVACYQGPFGSTSPCTQWSSDGEAATFTAADLRVGHGFTISVAWPPGTFDDIAPILADRSQYGSVPSEPGAIEMGPIRAGNTVAVIWPWLLLGWLLVLAVRAWRRVEAGRDLHFVGLPPGVLPAGLALAPEGRAGGGAPPADAVAPVRTQPAVAVRFTPPDTLSPAEAGVLESEWADNSLLAATLVDLAVRGHLTFETAKTGTDGEPTDWRLHRTRDADTRGLKTFERGALEKVFGKEDSVLLSGLDEKFAARLAQFREEITKLSDSRGFFRTEGLLFGTSTASRASCLLGVLWLLGAGAVVALLIVGAETGRSLAPLAWALAVPLVTYPILLLTTKKASHGRSAEGRALYEQIRGFRQFLTTADADRLRWEEGQDIFSSFLPWAMVFGVTERWTAIFAELAARGVATPRPTWYVGEFEFGPQLYAGLGRSVASFSQQATTTFASTPGSTGSSGSFSGSGGFSGGGGGGGGGIGGR
ncbi:MAG: DUF2207 domain-containing protein [Actinomycetota bacterium]